jgi:hypothetical protein
VRGCSVAVVRGGVLDDGWEKLGIAVGSALADAQPDISKARIAHTALCM